MIHSKSDISAMQAIHPILKSVFRFINRVTGIKKMMIFSFHRTCVYLQTDCKFIFLYGHFF